MAETVVLKILVNQSPLSTKNLGLSWKTEADKLVYRLKLNFNKKSRNRYSGGFTTLDSLADDFPKEMTKRIALKLNHQIFDPCMLIQPWIMKMRLAFRDIVIYERETGISSWDGKLPDRFREEWFDLTKEMFELETLEFDRSIVPKNYDPSEEPILVLFSDGSDKGMCVVAYLIWKLLDGTIHVSLITSRTKISSINKITTPRAELTGAQMQARLKNWLLSVLDITIKIVVHLVDASIVLGMIKNISLKFDTYTAPRVSEIQSTTEIGSWHWIETSDNPSDLGTRGKISVKDLGPDSLWRNGPSWLKLPMAEWPLRSDFRKHEVPGLKKEFEIFKTASNLTQLMELNSVLESNNSNDANSIFVNSNDANSIFVNSSDANRILVNSIDDNQQVATSLTTTPQDGLGNNTVLGNIGLGTVNISNILDCSKFSSWFRLIEVTAKVIIGHMKFSKLLNRNKNITIPSQIEAMEMAKSYWFSAMMKSTKEMLQKTKLHGLIQTEENGIVYVIPRVRQENWNPEKLVVLSPKHELTKLILRSMHDVDHRGVNFTLARSRIFYWIPQASKILKKIKSACFKCRLLDHEAMKQFMAPLPAYRLKCAPVWHYSMLDLFGPIQVRDFVNQRTSRKTWGVLITCLTTRACFAYLAESFSTDHLLAVLKKHESRNGSPAEYFADLGTQIVGADRVMSEAVENLSKNALEKFSNRTPGVKIFNKDNHTLLGAPPIFPDSISLHWNQR